MKDKLLERWIDYVLYIGNVSCDYNDNLEDWSEELQTSKPRNMFRQIDWNNFYNSKQTCCDLYDMSLDEVGRYLTWTKQ